ncbi:MAG TPA: hypothetical protein VIR26_06940 [Metalysinibacillus sp.]
MNSLTIGLLLMALPHPLAQIIACFVLLRANTLTVWVVLTSVSLSLVSYALSSYSGGFVLLGALWLLYASAVKTKSQKVGWLHGLFIVNSVLYSFTLNGGLDMRALLIMITLLLIIWQVTVLPPVFFTFILLMGIAIQTFALYRIYTSFPTPYVYEVTYMTKSELPITFVTQDETLTQVSLSDKVQSVDQQIVEHTVSKPYLSLDTVSFDTEAAAPTSSGGEILWQNNGQEVMHYIVSPTFLPTTARLTFDDGSVRYLSFDHTITQLEDEKFTKQGASFTDGATNMSVKTTEALRLGKFQSYRNLVALERLVIDGVPYDEADLPLDVPKGANLFITTHMKPLPKTIAPRAKLAFGFGSYQFIVPVQIEDVLETLKKGVSKHNNAQYDKINANIKRTVS